MIHAVLEFPVVDIAILAGHFSATHRAFFKDTTELIAVGKLNTSGLSQASFTEDTREYISVVISQGSRGPLAVSEFTNVIGRDSRFLTLALLLFFFFTIACEGLFVDQSAVAMHEPVVPLTIIDISGLELHDSSALEGSCFVQRKLPKVLAFVAHDLAVDELVILEFASIVTT